MNFLHFLGKISLRAIIVKDDNVSISRDINDADYTLIEV